MSTPEPPPPPASPPLASASTPPSAPTNPAPTSPESTTSTPTTRTTVQLLAAAGIVLVFVAGAVAILIATGGRLNKGYAVAFFVVTALVAGTAFWAFTPTDDSRNAYTQPSVRLAGGAAIGLVFALMAWKVVDEDSPYVVTEIPPLPSHQALNAEPGDGLMEAEVFPGRSRTLLYARFAPEATKGDVSISWFDPKSETGRRLREATVDQKGGFQWHTSK